MIEVEKEIEPLMLPAALFALDHKARLLTKSFGLCTYIVGSSLIYEAHRDIDVRCILEDDVFNQVFGDNKLRLQLFNTAIAEWFGLRTMLPIDFQFQRKSEADTYEGPRYLIGEPL